MSAVDVVSPEERAVRVDLAAAYRLVDAFGWSDLIETHLSVRVPGPEHHFLINPYGMLFEEITASSLVKVDLRGQIVGRTASDFNPAGFTIHSAIHVSRPEHAAVMHTHTPAGNGVAMQRDGLLPLSQHALLIMDGLGYHDFEGAALNEGERERIVADLGDAHTMILRNHGLLTVGRTVAEAFMRMYRAERACRMQLAFQQSGATPYPISKPVQDMTIEQGRRYFAADGPSRAGQREWPALLRYLDRRDPSFRN